MKQTHVEIWVGLFILAGFLAFCYLAFNLGEMTLFSDAKRMTITAAFDNISGVKKGSSVQIAGVPVGTVTRVTLNDQNVGQVSMKVDNTLKIPVDSMASVKSQGIVGDKYIQITLGGDKKFVQEGGALLDTESAVDIDSLLGSFAFGGVQKVANGSSTMAIKADFDNISGVKKGTPVLIAGVPVGTVTQVVLNGHSVAEVLMKVEKTLQIPTDSVASVKSQGIIGGKYIQISLGGGSELVREGGELVETESAVDLESLISKFAFGGVQKEK